jgi:hypothetical protein
MKARKANVMLPGPGAREVKIWFQGMTGSGKSLLARAIQDALEARGLTVRPYVIGGPDHVPMDRQFVDLTNQNIHDVLTVELHSGEELSKLMEVSPARWAKGDDEWADDEVGESLAARRVRLREEKARAKRPKNLNG